MKKLNFNEKKESTSVDYSNVLSKSSDEKYWLDLVERNNVPQGYGIGSDEFDAFYRLKPKTLVGIFGIDNVGKTTFYIFLIVCYALKHGLKFLILARENECASVRQKIMELYLGKYVHQCSAESVKKAREFSYEYFDIIKLSVEISKDNIFDLLSFVYSKQKYYATLIDPYNAVQFEQSPKSNYEFIKNVRSFQNSNDTSFHISMHISTDKARNYIYNNKDTITTFNGEEISVSGQMKIPRKNFVEGGQPVANKLDDILIVHRIPKIEELRNYTLVSVDKVKEEQTGGMVSFEKPILFKKHYGFISFTDSNGFNPINNQEVKYEIPKANDLNQVF